MSYQESAAGIVVFAVNPSNLRRYLILKNAAGHWEFSKGHPVAGESRQKTALRELQEETGLVEITLIPGFSREIRYIFRNSQRGVVQKVVRFCLGRSDVPSIELSHEHTDYAWLSFEQAVGILTHVTTRAVLREAEAFMLDVQQRI